MTELDATGERFMPEAQHGELVHAEHLVRYRLAAQLASSRRVLDVACGEGYGTALLAARGARSAVGVDLDEHTIAHARSHHSEAEFIVGDARELPFDHATFDLVVSFETVEHVPDPHRVLAELHRVTTEDGLVLVSTPNKHQYLVENEFHERELFHEEFLELLHARFDRVQPLLQHNWMTSAVLMPAEARDATGEEAYDLELAKVAGIDPGGELYTLALCGSRDLPSLRPVGVASGVDESHRLAERLAEAERTAERWHSEYRRAEQTLIDVYGSVWWRMTAPARGLVEKARRRGG
jgi:SAM-dependent methyltransferase